MGKMSSFVIGSLLGAGVALMVAPRTGAETRAMVGQMANGLASGVQDLANSPEGIDAQQLWSEAQAKGEELAAKVGAYAAEAVTKVTEVAATAYTKVEGVAADAAVKAVDEVQSVISKASERVTAEAEAIPAFTDKEDELRARMEAARQRIAEQIAKNAEEAKAKMDAIVAAQPTAADPDPADAAPAAQ